MFEPNERLGAVLWPRGRGSSFVPADSPECGFDDERCRSEANPVLAVAAALVAAVIAIGVGFASR